MAASVLASVAGLTASVWVKSPQEKAAEAAPPPASVLTVQVQQRVLTSTVVLRGEVVADTTVEATPTARGGGWSVVTAVPVKAGDEIPAGKVLLEVAGRPLVAFPGAKPAFRDLRPGYTGDDVAQLQTALKEMGFNPGEPDGRFGAGTKRALIRFYESIGYPTIPTGENDNEQLDAAVDRVKQAERALADAQDVLAAAPAEEKEAAQKAVDRAAEDLAAARSSRNDLIAATGPTLPLDEYVFLPTFPARVDGLTAEVGKEVTAPAITLSTGELKVRAVLNPGQEGLIEPGMPVEVYAEAVGVTAAAKVESVGDLHTDRQDPTNTGYPVVIAGEPPLAKQLVGQNVRLSVSAARSDGEVLVVPIAAIYSGADGSVSVIRRNPDGTEERVPVVPGLHGGGYVAITGDVDEGDEVVIGEQRP